MEAMHAHLDAVWLAFWVFIGLLLAVEIIRKRLKKRINGPAASNS